MISAGLASDASMLSGRVEAGAAGGGEAIGGALAEWVVMQPHAVNVSTASGSKRGKIEKSR